MPRPYCMAACLWLSWRSRAEPIGGTAAVIEHRTRGSETEKDAKAGDIEKIMLGIVEQGAGTARVLSLAMRNVTWRHNHAEQVAVALDNLHTAIAAIQNIANQTLFVENYDEVERPTKTDGNSSVATADVGIGIPEQFVFAGAFVTCVAMIKGHKLFDLFTPEVHSRWIIAWSFALASELAIVLVGRLRAEVTLGYEPKFYSPVGMYVSQILVCLISATTTMPIVIGCHRESDQGLIFVSWISLVVFLIFWVKNFIWQQLSAFFRSPLHIWITVMAVGQWVLMSRVLWRSWYGPRSWTGIPFFKVYQQHCAEYRKQLVRGGSNEDNYPVFIPAALLSLIVICISLVAISHVNFLVWAQANHAAFRNYLVGTMAFLGMDFSSSEFPLMVIEYSSMFIVIATCSSAFFAYYLLRRLVDGYVGTFRALAKGQPFDGHLVVRARPIDFHPKWATYLAGAVFGNVSMGCFVVGFLTYFVLLFWAFVADFGWLPYVGAYIEVVLLLYGTRWCIFYFAIPGYVMADSGEVLWSSVWSVVFPTLTLLNVVLGATSGVVRALVMFPVLLPKFFRLDTTLMPDDWVQWDWSYQPFLSFVLHSHSLLNPVMRDAARVLLALAHTHPQVPSKRYKSYLRVRNRWRLMVLLARNPSLRAYRKSALQRSRGYVLDWGQRQIAHTRSLHHLPTRLGAKEYHEEEPPPRGTSLDVFQHRDAKAEPLLFSFSV